METQKYAKNLQQKSSERIPKEKDPVVAFQQRVLASGISGFKDIGRRFRIFDKDRNQKLDQEELEWLIQNRGIKCGSKTAKEVAAELMSNFDKNSDGTINFEEFLDKLKPKMNDKRKALVKTVFTKMDKTGDGVIKVDDIIELYDVSKHPDYQNGKKTKRELLVELLKAFELDDHTNPGEEIEITLEEWTDFFHGISASIDEDAYFDLMMRNAWKI